jgi:surfeit locus 1 family protein
MFSSFQKYRFTPGFLPSAVALAVFLLTTYLGQWQQGRAAEKYALQKEFDDRSKKPPVVLNATTRDFALRFRRATAEGTWQPGLQIFVDNKVEADRAGYHVITPLKLVDTNTYLLVNRGWIARSSAYPKPPTVEVPSGQFGVSGSLSIPSSRFMELSDVTIENHVWQNLTPERYRLNTGLDVLPFVLLAQDAYPPLRNVVEKPDARAEKHVEYMLTWYSLAIAVVVIWVVTNFHASGDRTDT